MAVLSLTVAGLGIALAPAATAADPSTGDAAKTFVVNASGAAIRVYHNESSNETNQFGYHNLQVGQVMSSAQDIPHGVRTSGARVAAWSSDEFTYRNNQTSQQTLQGPVARTESPYPVLDAPSFSGGAYDHNRFRYASISGSTDAHTTTDGSCLAVGDVLSGAESTTRNFDYLPRTRFSGHVLDAFSPTSSNDAVTVRTTHSMYRLANGRRGLRSEAEGSAAAFTLLNQQVRVDVISGPRVIVENDGDTPTITTTGADISITGPDAVTHRFNGVTGALSYTDVNDPSLSMTLSVNTGVGVHNVYSNTDFVNASGAVTAVAVDYFDSSQVNRGAGSVQVGQLGASSQVPNSGVDCGPEPDTDSDGLSDYEETGTYDTDPNDDDSDNDGVLDGAEVKTHLTDPNNPDTDADNLTDGGEVTAGTNPLVRDTDGDGLWDGDEVRIGSSPLKKDTDGGSVDDWTEHDRGTDPLNAGDDVPPIADPPAVPVTPVAPVALVAPVAPVDSDHDGLTDAEEAALGTDPNSRNSDGDRLTDDEEVALGLSPLKKDTDGDRLGDYREVVRTRTNPLRKDTDADGLSDYREVAGTRTNPRRKDTDRDGVKDLREVKAGSDPTSAESTPRHH